MKEMCKNFICDGCCGMQTASMMGNTMMGDTMMGNTMMGNTMMGDCNACVIKRVGLAQAFVPSQPYQMPMEQEQSLVCGTAFSDLVMPYCSGWNLYRFGKEA